VAVKGQGGKGQQLYYSASAQETPTASTTFCSQFISLNKHVFIHTCRSFVV